NGVIAADLPVKGDMSTWLCWAGRTIPAPCNDVSVDLSLTMNRSTETSLQGAGMVRPAQHSQVLISPLTGRSAAMTPLGPQAAQAMMASSSSERGCGCIFETYPVGPFSWTTVFPLPQVIVSDCPDS